MSIGEAANDNQFQMISADAADMFRVTVGDGPDDRVDFVFCLGADGDDVSSETISKLQRPDITRLSTAESYD